MKKLITAKFKKILSLLLTTILLLSTISGGVWAADPKVSIIIPVYNTPENLLRDCLNSAKNQTLKDIEIICVDDGSTDGSGKILDEYEKNDPRFKVVHQKNGGVSVARNKGMNLAKGEYIKFLDSDDMIDEIAAEKSYSIAKEFDADMVRYSLMEEEKGKSKILQEHINIKHFKIINSPSFHPLRIVPIWGGIYKNKFLKDNNLKFFEKVLRGNDQLFNMTCIPKANKIIFCPDKMYLYRYNNKSLIASVKVDKHKDTALLGFKSLFQQWENSGYFSNINFKLSFLYWLLNFSDLSCSGFLKDCNVNRTCIETMHPYGLLQDDVINLLPSKERAQIRNMMKSAKNCGE